ncbi:MAG TPA: hypothetical protein VMV49_17715 [Candidatus Deferrimicrobium sp.]|nr:hypothetical protein [Candidatus Deferrimicrobium sp.]
MPEKDPAALSAEQKEQILKSIKVTVFQKSVMFYFDPDDIGIVKEALRKGGFVVGKTQTYNG